MNVKKFLKTHMIALTLPVFSIAIATGASAVQDSHTGTSSSYTSDWSPPNQTSGRAYDRYQNTLRPGAVTDNPAERQRQRTQSSVSPNGLRQVGFEAASWFRNQDEDPNWAEAAGLPSALGGADDDRQAQSSLSREKIDPRVAGWHGAAHETARGGVSDMIRASWVMLSQNGNLKGTVHQASGSDDGATNIFILRNGQVAAETTVDENGNFEVDGLLPGPVTIVVFGKSNFAAFGFNALPYNTFDQVSPRSLNVLPSPRSGRIVPELVKTLAPMVSFRIFDLYDVGEGPEDPPHLYGQYGLRNYPPPATPATSVNHHPVRLVNGIFTGRIHQLDSVSGRPIDVRNATVHIIQNDAVVATSRVDNLGIFKIEGLGAGTYGVIAGGSDGFAATGVEIIDSTSSNFPSHNRQYGQFDSQSRTSARFVSNEPSRNNFANFSSDVFDICMIPPESIGWLNHHVARQDYLEAVNTPLPQQPDPHGFGMGGYQGFGGDYGYGYGGYGGFGDGAFIGGAWPVGLGAIIYNAIDDTGRGRRPISPTGR
ncbi:MAG TPA: carboxypeptidase-like regulatory domain-containing protein [Pirellulaceae bacterium]|nr:carboxypeptidase-like regulatory domain-containing protein [Pirellulaceae bacterium]HMO90787.1 carboxypeptidase-like regulatory domain-containing protein [Pirellulaceae bacterium]